MVYEKFIKIGIVKLLNELNSEYKKNKEVVLRLGSYWYANLINKLEMLGIIESKTVGRVKYIKLTEKGIKLKELINEIVKLLEEK